MECANILCKNKYFYKYINILHHKNNTLLIKEIQFKKNFCFTYKDSPVLYS